VLSIIIVVLWGMLDRYIFDKHRIENFQQSGTHNTLDGKLVLLLIAYGQLREPI